MALKEKGDKLMKVWVVKTGEWDEETYNAICSTEQKAQEIASQHRDPKDVSILEWEVDVMPSGYGWPSAWNGIDGEGKEIPVYEHEIARLTNALKAQQQANVEITKRLLDGLSYHPTFGDMVKTLRTCIAYEVQAQYEKAIKAKLEGAEVTEDNKGYTIGQGPKLEVDGEL
jgi:hypothetical protein